MVRLGHLYLDFGVPDMVDYPTNCPSPSLAGKWEVFVRIQVLRSDAESEPRLEVGDI